MSEYQIIKTLEITKDTIICERNTFGTCLLSSQLNKITNNEYIAVILATNEGYGWNPIGWISLEHQIYKEKLEKMLNENPNIKEFVLIPINHKDYNVIAKVKTTFEKIVDNYDI